MTIVERMREFGKALADVRRELADIKSGKLHLGFLLSSHARVFGGATLSARATPQGVIYSLSLPTGQRYESGDICEVFNQADWMLAAHVDLPQVQGYLVRMSDNEGLPPDIRRHLLAVFKWLRANEQRFEDNPDKHLASWVNSVVADVEANPPPDFPKKGGNGGL